MEKLGPVTPKERRRIDPRSRSVPITKSTLVDGTARRNPHDPMATDASNPTYVRWLESQSMLADADRLSRKLSGKASMWRNPYARPDARRALSLADVWFTAYPVSLITDAEESFIGTLASDKLWNCFSEIGINAIHTGPVKCAGGITGWDMTPSIDGHFDRVSTHIDPSFGTEGEFRNLCTAAAKHKSSIIDDIVPAHTGKGADFRLAEMAYEEYPGIYHMVEIDESDWGLLPSVEEGHDSANLSESQEKAVADAGYIIGKMQRVMFYLEGVKETNWSATGPVLGVDGKTRRWVYLHYFKDGQPSINWLDPTFAGVRMIAGDAIHSLANMGSTGLRLDANGFLGIELSAIPGQPAWSQGHPLSIASNHLIAGMARKVGGFTFQEMNLTIEDIRDSLTSGADLSYDFVTRPGYHHAFITGDTEFLRLCFAEGKRLGVEPVSLVHGLQNHDEVTYELVHWETTHADETYDFRGGMTGRELAGAVRGELVAGMTGDAADYNHIFTTNGIALTNTSMIAAKFGHKTMDTIGEKDIPDIRRAHLLLAKFSAWQPGAFALSGWDLVGALPLPLSEIAEMCGDGDVRWINRGAHDLIGVDPDATASESGIPRAVALYGSVDEQLKDPESFASQLKKIIAVRAENYMCYATQLDVPAVDDPGMLAMVHRLDGGWIPESECDVQVTVLNFSDRTVKSHVRSSSLVPGMKVIDAETETELVFVSDNGDGQGSFEIELGPYDGRFLIIS